MRPRWVLSGAARAKVTARAAAVCADRGVHLFSVIFQLAERARQWALSCVVGTPFLVHSEGALFQGPCMWQGPEDNRKLLPPAEGKPSMAQTCLDSGDASLLSAGRLQGRGRGFEALLPVLRPHAYLGSRGFRASEQQPQHKGPDANGVLGDPRWQALARSPRLLGVAL